MGKIENTANIKYWWQGCRVTETLITWLLEMQNGAAALENNLKS